MRHVGLLLVALAVLGAVAFIVQPKPDATCNASQESWGWENGRIVPAPDICISYSTPRRGP
jgi:hypothetical protein